MATEELLVRVRADVKDALSGLDRLENAVEGTGEAAQGMQRRMGGANSLMLEFSRFANDSQQFAYGFRQGLVAVSNQVDGLAYAFRRLAQEGGGVRGALRAIGQSLTGAGGIVLMLNLAATAAVLFGDKIAAAMGQAKTGAKDAADYIANVRDALDDLLSVDITGIGKFGANLGELQAALGRIDAEIRDARGRLTQAAQTGEITSSDPLVASALAVLQNDLARYTAAREAIVAEIGRAQATTTAAGVLRDLGLREQSRGRIPSPGGTAGRSPGREARTVADAMGNARAEVEALRRLLTEGLISPLRFAEDRAAALWKGLEQANALLGPGNQMTPALRAFGQEAQAARREVAGLATTAGRPLADGLDGAAGAVRSVTVAFSDLARGPGPLAIEMMRGLREGALSASLAVGDGLAAAFGRLVSMQDTFADFGRSIVRSLQQMVAAFTEAIARALLFQAVTAALNLFAPGVGKFVGGALGIAGGGGMKFAPVPSAPALSLGTGTMRVTGGALVGLIRAELAAEAASGRGSGAL